MGIRDEEIELVNGNGEMDEREKDQILRVKMMKSSADILEEVEVLIDTHFFNDFCQTKSSMFLKRVIENQSAIEMTILKRTWRTLNALRRP